MNTIKQKLDQTEEKKITFQFYWSMKLKTSIQMCISEHFKKFLYVVNDIWLYIFFYFFVSNTNLLTCL